MKVPAYATMPFSAPSNSPVGPSGAGPSRRALIASCLSALMVMVFTISLGFAAPEEPGEASPDDSGSDPTVGTLPSYGNSDFDHIDQTVTLRGSYADLRAAVVSAQGAGAVEAIDLGDGNYWIRYYGDVDLELDLEALTRLEVEIFSGFQGNGLNYSVGQANGFGEPRHLVAGGSIRLDPLRFHVSGLLDETVFVACLHRTGDRTMTSMDFRPVDGTVVIRQDI